jgi:REP element-mobilizing transposase RayT
MIMPRIAREKSVYHVMLRGIDKKDLFLNDSDYQKFIDYIERAKEKIEFTVHAYCLMTNHTHLLLKKQTASFEIGDIVKRITAGYAQYHNVKNGRTGHLFQNRFKSETVDSDTYFLTVLRYIHQNPVKAGMVKNLHDYKWSSYNEYLNKKNVLIEPTFALAFFKDIGQFEMFMKQSNEDKCLENNPPKRYTDEDLEELVSSFAAINNLCTMDIEIRNNVLKNIKEVTGANNRQLSRVIGILEKIK